jgi:hypothetical protein
MNVDESPLYKHIKALSNQELLRMLSENPAQYRPEALVLAKEECSNRRLSLDSREWELALDEKAKAKRFLEAIHIDIRAVIDALGRKAVRGAGLWFIFAAVQLLGFVFHWYVNLSQGGHVSWLFGFILLLPGNLFTMLAQIWNYYSFLFVTVVCNALVWLVCSKLWRRFQKSRQKMRLHRYTLSLAATGLVLVIANIVHGPTYFGADIVTYGFPFTFYYEGGFMGYSMPLLRGLAGNALIVIGSSVLFGELWHLFSSRRKHVNRVAHQ